MGDDNQSSSEIRADIDQTRASVGNKIDQLQARLDPNRLKEQAAETVQEMLSDTANSMTEYVRTHKDEMVSSVVDAARRNPLPTALVGLGLGWLILESMAGRRDDDRGYEYARRNLAARSRTDYSPQYYDQPDYARSGYPASAAYGYSSEAQYASSQYTPGNGHQQGENPIAKAADAVKDKVSDAGSEIKDRVQDAGHAVKEGIENMGNAVQDRMRGAADDMRQQAGHMGYEGQRRFEQGYDRAGNRIQEWRHEAGHQMHEWRDRARYEGRRRGRQLANNLEDNPLTYGAVALAAGAALGLLLPQTRAENRAFGATRDELMDRGQEAWRSAKHHAQEVVEEVRPELEQKVREIAHDVKETGKQAAKDAAEELRPVMDKAVAKGKEEARSVAQESGIDPDMLSGKSGDKPALNRDTLQGQWKQVKGEVKSQWGKLTDDDMTRVEGDFEKLLGSIQTRYGYTRERAEQEVNDFFKKQSASSPSTSASTTPSTSKP
jgi:uncharacterized protein YjbJ (UPF0337 family)/ElaB/YqjD/DUF883 family membrane-anchored ribosome-binding protein